MPYPIVEQGGQLSIDRLKEAGTWPGTYTNPILKYDESNVIPEWKTSDDVGDWKTWDFVPDGLLVWEAWLEWWEREKL